MREPFHQTIDREYPDRDKFADLDRAASSLLDLDLPKPGLIKRAILARYTTTEWLVSRLTPDGGTALWPGHNPDRLRQGTTAKIIYHDDIRGDTRHLSGARDISTRGALVRTTSAWMPDMVISDRQIAIVTADRVGSRGGLICTEQPAIVLILASLFDQVWNSATPLALDPAPKPLEDGHVLLDAERNLLKLLADGMTDETVARQLGISLRTTRRHIAALMSHLAASSRFQAGVEAAKRGWLSLANGAPETSMHGAPSDPSHQRPIRPRGDGSHLVPGRRSVHNLT